MSSGSGVRENKTDNVPGRLSAPRLSHRPKFDRASAGFYVQDVLEYFIFILALNLYRDNMSYEKRLLNAQVYYESLLSWFIFRLAIIPFDHLLPDSFETSRKAWVHITLNSFLWELHWLVCKDKVNQDTPSIAYYFLVVCPSHVTSFPKLDFLAIYKTLMQYRHRLPQRNGCDAIRKCVLSKRDGRTLAGVR